MQLYTNCKSCKRDIKIKSNALTRPDLQMDKGDEFSVNCLNCGKIEKKHINDIKAQPNTSILIIGAVLGVFAAAILWFIYGAIGTVAIIIPLLFWQQQMSSVKSFNAYMIKRK